MSRDRGRVRFFSTYVNPWRVLVMLLVSPLVGIVVGGLGTVAVLLLVVAWESFPWSFGWLPDALRLLGWLLVAVLAFGLVLGVALRADYYDVARGYRVDDD